jgi:DNA ligase-associated metallophosphoesterase
MKPRGLSERASSERDPAAAAAPRYKPARLKLGACEFLACPSGALFWPDCKLLVISDMHFEKGSAFATRRVHLPPYDTSATLRALAGAIKRFAPERVIALGDSFHDENGPARLAPEDRARIQDLTAACDWIWIRGNHDADIDPALGGTIEDQVELAGITFTHLPGLAVGTREIAGHLHPVAKLAARGRRLRRRCFASDGLHLVMPAFGAYAGGLNVLDEAFDGLFAGSRFHAYVLGRHQVYPVPRHRLLPD